MEMENFERRSLLNQGDLPISASSKKNNDDFGRALKGIQINQEELCALKDLDGYLDLASMSNGDASKYVNKSAHI
ncbi:hypothetical protein ACS0TY_030703 [Phlomoides rotata]